MLTQSWVCRLSAELVTAISIRLALFIPRCGCRTPCLVTLVFVAVAVGTVVPYAVRSVFHRSRSEATQGVSLSHVSEHALIPWAVLGYNFMEWVSCVVGESVMLAGTPVPAHSSRLLPTPCTCRWSLLLTWRWQCATYLISSCVSSCFRWSRKEWTYGNTLVGMFNDVLAHLRRVANLVYSDLGCSSITCLAIGLAVLKWTSTSCLGRFSHSLCRWAPRQTRPARRLTEL